MTGTRTYRAALAAALAVLTVSTASAQSLAGRWDATLTINSVVIPFRLDVAGEGASLTARSSTAIIRNRRPPRNRSRGR